MGLFKNRKWKENQADKIAKNKKRSIEPSGYINSDYQLVDISIRSMYDLIDRVREFTGDTKILGTARLIQRVSQIIAAVRFETDDIEWDIAAKYGIKNLPVSEGYAGYVKDLYFIIGTIRDFYCYCLECNLRKLPNKAAATFSNWLNKFDSEIFTVEQYDAMGWDNFHAGIDSIEENFIDNDMVNLIDQKSIKNEEFTYVTISESDGIDCRTDLMNMADYFLPTGGLTGVAVIKGCNVKIYHELSKNIVTDGTTNTESGNSDSPEEDDMTACEIIE